MRSEHRWPLVAALVILLACSGVIAHGLRTDAFSGFSRPMRVLAGTLVEPAHGVDRAGEAPQPQVAPATGSASAAPTTAAPTTAAPTTGSAGAGPKATGSTGAGRAGATAARTATDPARGPQERRPADRAAVARLERDDVRRSIADAVRGEHRSGEHQRSGDHEPSDRSRHSLAQTDVPWWSRHDGHGEHHRDRAHDRGRYDDDRGDHGYDRDHHTHRGW